MRRYFRHSAYTLIAVVCLMLVLSPTAGAQTYTLSTLPDQKVYNDFVVGPGKTELILNPGESRTVIISIANRLGTEKTFSLSEEDTEGSNDPNQPIVLLGDDRGPYSLKDVLSIATTSVDIPHAEKAFVPVTISIPADAQPGGLYGSVLVSVKANADASPADSANTTDSNPVITRLATLFFVRVAGNADESGRLADFSLSGGHSIMFDEQPLDFNLVFKNDGNVHLVPHGTITVSNIFNSPIANIDVDPWFAMPQSLRFRQISWMPPFLFGRYTARAYISRGYASTSDQANIVFWVIPWKIIAGIVVGLTLVVFVIRWFVSRVHISFGRKA
ncbi:MAG: hypothetical protein KGI59_02285 [Patescibacteria group bacterium]|nr:hypothetical protein [Patescibacteria group bacterium]